MPAAALPGRVGCLSLIASLGLFAPFAWSIGLGEVETSSRLGQQLQARIALQTDASEEVTAECIRLEGPRHEAGDEVPWLRSGRLRLETRNGKPVLMLSSIESITAPVLMFAIRLDCGMSLRREYTLLLNPPGQTDAPVAESANSAGTAHTTSGAGALRTTTGETLQSLASNLFPSDRGLQARYITMLRRQNPGKLNGVSNTTALPPGTELSAPEITAVMDAAPAPTPTPVARPQSRRAEGFAPRPAGAGKPSRRSQPRLVLGRSDGTLQMATQLEGRKEFTEAQRERLRVELQLIATLDEKIATQLELSEKLRQLEALQTRLQSDVAALESRLQTQQTQIASTGSAPAVAQPVPVSATPVVARPAPTNAASPYAVFADNPLWWLTIPAVILAGALLWSRRTRRGRNDQISQLDVVDAPPDSSHGTESTQENLFEPLSEDDIWPDLVPGKSPPLKPDLADLPTLSEHGPASVLHIVEDVEEHDSAVELAEIMMSFGRVQGAAQTLADFIRANPLQAVKPWVKLLEVYKAGGMRSEFDALTQQLNKTFNVKPVSWDDFEVALRAPESLEHMPHVQAQLCRLWGTRECQAWLHQLLRDNRQGTRQGFPLAIVDEILLLLAILEASLGAYRPDAEVPQAPPATNQPATVATPTTRVIESSTTQPGLSFADLDLNTETADLSRTLHINLDELPDEDTRTTLEPRRFDLD